MDIELAVLVPVLNRPQNVKPLVDSFIRATSVPFKMLFICDLKDTAEIDAVQEQLIAHPDIVDYRLFNGPYGQKINHGVQETDTPLLFFGADDLRPQRGWFNAAKKYLDQGYEVVGVNDMLDRPRRPEHAAHFVVTREYAELPTIDGASRKGRPQIGPMYPGYYHWYVDDEFAGTAKKRETYAYAAKCRIKHLHYTNEEAPDDDTYRKGRNYARIDFFHYRQRAHLWM